MMTLPLTDSALIGSCMAAAALGVLVLSSAGNSTPESQPPAAAMVAPVADTSPATADATPTETEARDTVLADLGAEPVPAPAADPVVTLDATSMDPDEFGAQVRRFLLQNPEVIFEAVAEFERRNTMMQAEMDGSLIAANYDAIFNDGHSWVGGNPAGDITLVEFMDYACSFCKRAHDEVWSFLETDGNVRFIIKEFPILGPESELASRFAIAVLQLEGDDAYALIHDALMRHEGGYSPAMLRDLAVEHGLDADALLARLGDESITDVLNENRMLAQRLQISGTPSFIMNSEFVRGFVPAETLAEIAAELRE